MLILGQKSCIWEPPSFKFHNRTDINIQAIVQQIHEIREIISVALFNILEKMNILPMLYSNK